MSNPFPASAVGSLNLPFHADPSLATFSHSRRRYKVRFPSRDAYHAARATELPTVYRSAVESARRAFISVELPVDTTRVASAVRNEAATLTLFEREFGARIIEDFHYDLESTELFEAAAFLPEDAAQASMDEVLAMIGAPAAWDDATGEGVIIAVVDTGINGARREIPTSRRVGGWAPIGEDPWTDWQGHGTMCGVIAAGSRNEGGSFDGVAPAARCCRSRACL